jgi:hypothetical protein
MRGCTHSKTFSRAQGIRPFHKRSFWNAVAGAAFNGIGIAQVRASRGISGFGLTVCSKLDARG